VSLLGFEWPLIPKFQQKTLHQLEILPQDKSAQLIPRTAGPTAT